MNQCGEECAVETYWPYLKRAQKDNPIDFILILMTF